MVNNELALLDQVLRQRQADRLTPMRDDNAFELFVCEQALHGRDLSADEIADGVIGGGNDGGIDGVYVLLNGISLSEDSDVFHDEFSPSKVPTGTRLELWLIQGKRETSFTETAIEKVADSTRRLLSLSEEEDDLRKLYSSEIVSRTGFFRDALRALATRHPQVEINFVYATRGRTEELNTKVEIKAQDLRAQLSGVITGALGNVDFLGAAELWRRVNSVPSYTMQLTCQEIATSGNSYVALVKLRDYMSFLSDQHGDLRRHIFDWNVRDYQGDVEVNREIRGSLQDPTVPEFWWLNNGITIVCSRASGAGKTYSLDDVQVVNGLQTSHTIYNVLRSAGDDHHAMEQAVLVRILVTGDEPATRDRVIRATNRQTSVPAASLRATDDIQRDIEAFFYGHGWFYDRRKNYYRNKGKSLERIVSIPLLAQAVMAMGLSRPDNSRARPSSLLKRNEEYQTIFSGTVPLEVYLWLAESQKAVDAFLVSEDANATTQERTNLRFHLAMVAAAKLAGLQIRRPQQLRQLAQQRTPITEAGLGNCLAEVRKCFEEFGKNSGDTADKISKGPKFVEYLLYHTIPLSGTS